MYGFLFLFILFSRVSQEWKMLIFFYTLLFADGVWKIPGWKPVPLATATLRENTGLSEEGINTVPYMEVVIKNWLQKQSRVNMLTNIYYKKIEAILKVCKNHFKEQHKYVEEVKGNWTWTGKCWNMVLALSCRIEAF